MKKIFLGLIILFLCNATVASAQKIKWDGLTGGWSYQNKFTKNLSSAYSINWNVTGVFTYEKWNMRINYSIPTLKYSFKQPFYNLTLEYQILKRKN